ncbi:hypothetical protein M9Y10_030772 [Tritrichomonas musculus]|uniref:F5/8 type C domain-containing protein n=1 Tax=Tritrichomonas musculus TaxID=1915356 RepID=A0ABR2H2Z3_9EUKA
MSNINKIQLKPSSILNVHLQKYPKDFTFIVNGKEFQTSQIITDLLSPKINQIHLNDPTFNTYVIDTQSQGDFSNILKLASLEEISIPENEIPFISEVIELLGSDSINFDFFETPTNLTLDNVFSLICKHEQFQQIFSKSYENELDFISSHFFELCESHKADLMKLSKISLIRITSNRKLQLKDEDQLLKFVNELYQRDRSFTNLYDFVHFLNVTSDEISEFISLFDMNDMTVPTWQSLCDRLKQKFDNDLSNSNNNNDNDSEGSDMRRYKKLKEKANPKDITFPVTSNNQFSGIFSYLKNKSSSQIENEVNFTASSIIGSDEQYQPRNVVLYEDKSKSFFSENNADSWICFEFKNHRVSPTNYTIRTANWGQNGHHPRSWVIEGSNDNSSWQVLDEERDCNELHGIDLVHTFPIKNQTGDAFKYIRMKQTGQNWYSVCASYYLIIDAFEIYGTLK